MTNYLDDIRYNGKVQAVILDWSGTTADAYVVAPAVVFVVFFFVEREKRVVVVRHLAQQGRRTHHGLHDGLLFARATPL